MKRDFHRVARRPLAVLKKADELVLQLGEPGQVRRRDALPPALKGARLEQQPQLRDMLLVRGAEIDDQEATVRLMREQPLLHQNQQGFTNGTAADLKLRREGNLTDILPRL